MTTAVLLDVDLYRHAGVFGDVVVAQVQLHPHYRPLQIRQLTFSSHIHDGALVAVSCLPIWSNAQGTTYAVVGQIRSTRRTLPVVIAPSPRINRFLGRNNGERTGITRRNDIDLHAVNSQTTCRLVLNLQTDADVLTFFCHERIIVCSTIN